MISKALLDSNVSIRLQLLSQLPKLRSANLTSIMRSLDKLKFVAVAMAIFGMLSVSQALAQATFTVAPPNHSFSAIGGTLDLTVTAPVGQAWTAASTEPWLSVVAGASGTGPGTVRVSAVQNETNLARTAQVNIGPAIVYFTQDPLVAVIRFNPDAINVGPAGAVRTIAALVEPPNLSWIATSDSNWITVLTPRDIGSGAITFVVATNASPATRVGYIRAMNGSLKVTQAGSSNTFQLSSTSVTLPFTGGNGHVDVSASSQEAAWYAYPLVNWISVDNATYTGSGQVQYSVQRNPTGTARQGGISIAGTTFLVSQDANPDPDNEQPVDPVSKFVLSSGLISFEATVGSTSETSRSLSISSSENQLGFNVEVKDAPWLRARRASGNTPDTIVFSANPTDLEVGTYYGTIRIISTSNGAVSQIPSRIRINPPAGTPATPTLSQPSLFFSRIVGSSVPALRRVRLGSLGQVLSANVAVTNSPIWLQASTQTDLDGTVITVAIRDVNMLPGLYEANVLVTSPNGQFADVRIPVAYRVQMAPMGAPYISSGGIVNSASYGEGIAPNTWISIFGSNLAKTTRAWGQGDFPGGALPTTLDGVSVKIGGNAAAVAYVSPGQLNVLAPAFTTLSRAEVVVTVDGESSESGVAYLTEVLPAFFAFGPQSGKYVAAVHLNGAPVGPTNLFPTGATARPAKPGEVVEMYGTGFGPTNPPVDPSKLFTGSAPLVEFETLEVNIGGMRATVGFAGLVGAGLNQLNVTIPQLPAGDHEVVAKVGGVYTKTGLYINVQP